MKIKNKTLSYEKVLQIKKEKHKRPKKPNIFFRTLMKIASKGELKKVGFSCQRINMEKLQKNEPAIFLMNHSSFIDLKIAAVELYPRPFNIVCTNDGFVGKRWIMRQFGCIPTRKFIADIKLVSDMVYATKNLKSSILMYPEASYSFDGTATPLPDSLGKCLKLLNVPVVIIKTQGSFARDPLYNMLQVRDVKVSATMEYILSKEDIENKTADEINKILKEYFTFDNFRWQQENNVVIDEPFRADGLNRVLYKCPACNEEGCMEGKGVELTCTKCGKSWTLDEYGFLRTEGKGKTFDHVPDWYRWERECVKEEIKNKTYKIDVPVNISILKDSRCLYNVGEGRLVHDINGFTLTGCGGKLNYTQPSTAAYSLYSDYYWYEIGDMISIGDVDLSYYCFPKTKNDIVAKARLATEELYKESKK